MKRFIPREKLGKKARRQLDSRQRRIWAFCPTTRTVESKKRYNRKRNPRDLQDDWNAEVPFCCGSGL